MFIQYTSLNTPWYMRECEIKKKQTTEGGKYEKEEEKKVRVFSITRGANLKIFYIETYTHTERERKLKGELCIHFC